MAIPISQQDIKLLWGRSGNRCAICKHELSQNAKNNNRSYPIGEQAHIVGESIKSPRGKSILLKKQRSSYHNLILLCPNHHTEIDKNIVDWPVEKLHMVKTEHELWVQQTLAETVDSRYVAQQAIAAAIIDTTTEKCRLISWQVWTSFALSPDPKWQREFPGQIFEFREYVMGAVWPSRFDELKRATITFSIILNQAAQTFLEHSKQIDDKLYPDKFYKTGGKFNPNYGKDIIEYEKWLDRCYIGIKEATKAANWFADIVRRDINPMYFAKEGKFLVTEGPFEDFSIRTCLLEFREVEKKHLPNSLHRRSTRKGKNKSH